MSSGREQRHDLLDPSVAGRRDLNPGRGEHCDLHRNPFRPPPVPTRCGCNAGLHGQSPRRPGEPRRHHRHQGWQRLPGFHARRPPAGRRRAPPGAVVPRLPLPVRARAAHLRAAAAAPDRHRRRGHAGRPRAHQPRPRAGERAEPPRRVAAAACGAKRGGRGRAAAADLRSQLPPGGDPAPGRAPARSGLPADARAARDRSEARAAGARRRARRLLARGARRGAPDHRHPRGAGAALGGGRVAGLRPGARAARRDRPGPGLRGVRARRRRGRQGRPAPPRRGPHRGDHRRPALQPHPRAFTRRPGSAPLRARRAVVLRRGRALVRHALRPRQPDHLVRDALVRPRHRRADAPAAGRQARAGVQRRARRGARQGSPRAARGRAGDARRDAVRALLRLGGCHTAVPVPAGAARQLVRQSRPLPRAARARRGRARVDRPLRRPGWRRPRRVPAALAPRAGHAGLEGLRRRRPLRRRRAARRRRWRSWRCRATCSARSG